jgi:hypothetical protein
MEYVFVYGSGIGAIALMALMGWPVAVCLVAGVIVGACMAKLMAPRST